jgi:Flp pilus assembly protein protease CpaA
MIPNVYVAWIFVGCVMGVLAHASYSDIKTRTIPKISAGLIYVFVGGYIIFAGKDPTVASLCFIFTFITFLCVWAISIGQFGLGDVLVLGALGWMVADLVLLKAFLVVLGVMTIPYGIFVWFYYRRQAKLNSKFSRDPYLYPYMPLIFFVTMLYILFPSIFLSLF